MIEALMIQAALKGDVMELMKRHQRGVTCTELCKIANFTGEYTWHLGGWPNVVIWAGMSKEAVEVMTDLIREKRIDIKPSHWLSYLIDGAVLLLPIFKCGEHPPECNPTHPHWLPVCFNFVEG